MPVSRRSREALIAARIERNDLVIALGGGVVGDLAGFAAAILRRGVDFVQVPTSLLAQVDSSVGGKTGINSPQGKNLLGAFHQPVLVVADTAVLDTLSPRQFRAGYAEVAKYGVLGDEAFFAWLEANHTDIFKGGAAREHAIATSCRAKAAIVARDERENGERALLNLGHTFGHALEAATGFSDRLFHGEGVAVGMVLAAEFSARLGMIPESARGARRASPCRSRPADPFAGHRGICPGGPRRCRRADGADGAGQEGQARPAHLHPARGGRSRRDCQRRRAFAGSRISGRKTRAKTNSLHFPPTVSSLTPASQDRNDRDDRQSAGCHLPARRQRILRCRGVRAGEEPGLSHQRDGGAESLRRAPAAAE